MVNPKPWRKPWRPPVIWGSKKAYGKFTNADLEVLLKSRNFPYSGTKKKKVYRLVEYDDTHPFRFLDLPPEVQNIIYEYHAAEDFGTFPKSFISYPNKELSIFSRLCKSKAFGLQRGPAATITAPNLFLTSKTTRDVGLTSFYLARPFCITTLTPQMGELAALRWLEAIGNERCKLIRSLKIAHFSNNMESLKDVMNHSHRKLSEKATVAYKCSDPQLLWGLGAEFQAGHPVGKGPTFSPQWGFKYDNFTQDCASLSFGEQYVTLEFLPNMGWFGQTTDLHGQSATEESPAEGSDIS